MVSEERLKEYMEEIRKEVCSVCIDRPPGGPPCEPVGKRCGVELNLPQIIDAIHSARSRLLDPYVVAVHEQVCEHCVNRPTNQCPCPLEYLLELVVESVEAVDDRHKEMDPPVTP